MVSRSVYILLALISICLVLRLSDMTFDSFWLDEAYQSLADAYGKPLPDFTKMPSEPFVFSFQNIQPISVLLANFRQLDPLCPPLYALVLNKWISLFGNSDFVIRALSVVFSLASLIALFYFTKHLYGLKVATFAGFLQAISPFDVYYAQEARMYSLISLTATLSGFSLLTILFSKPKGYKQIILFVVYCLSTWALINTHYTGLFLVIFQGILVGYYSLINKNWKIFLYMICAWLAIALLWLPWLHLFFEAAQKRRDVFYVTRPADFWWPIKALFLEIPFNWIEFLCGKKVMTYAYPVYLSGAAFLVMAALSTFKKYIKPDFLLASLWLWAIIPACGIWLIDTIECHRVIEVLRYLTITAPPVYVLASLGMLNFPLSTRTKIILLMTHICFALANNVYAHIIPQREPWREMAKIVSATCKSDDLILVSQPYDIVCLDRYLTKPLRQVGVSSDMEKEHINNLVSNTNRFVLLTAQEGESTAGKIPPEFRVENQVDLGHGLHLRFYQK